MTTQKHICSVCGQEIGNSELSAVIDGRRLPHRCVIDGKPHHARCIAEHNKRCRLLGDAQ